MDKINTRILIITSEFPPQPGGIGNHAYHLAKYLSLSHLQVEVITDQRSETCEEEYLFDRGLSFRVYRVPKTTLRFWMYLKRLQLALKHIKTAETVIASGKFSLWVVAFSSLFFKRQYIAVIHGTEVNFQNRILKWAVASSLKRFTRVIAVSHYTKSLVEHLQLKEVIVIPNGIDITSWDTEPKTSKVLHGHPKLITVGNVTERKGQLNLIKMLPELIKNFPELHYHCVGIPTEAERFLTVAKALNVDAHVTFHGRVDHTHLQQIVSSCDVFVMLSSATTTGDVEGFGIAILEANALGVPTIGAKRSGIEDAIQQGVSGFLIDHKDVQAFESALQQLLAHKEDFSKHAKAWAVTHDWKLIIDRYVGVIEDDG